MKLELTGLGNRVWVSPEHFSATADFYEKVLGLRCTFRNDSMRVATFDFDFGPYLVIEGCDPSSDPDADLARLPGRFTGITITVKDVEACYRHLLSLGVAFHEPPVKQPWGGVMAFFDDPGGNTQTLCQLP